MDNANQKTGVTYDLYGLLLAWDLQSSCRKCRSGTSWDQRLCLWPWYWMYWTKLKLGKGSITYSIGVIWKANTDHIYHEHFHAATVHAEFDTGVVVDNVTPGYVTEGFRMGLRRACRMSASFPDCITCEKLHFFPMLLLECRARSWLQSRFVVGFTWMLFKWHVDNCTRAL